MNRHGQRSTQLLRALLLVMATLALGACPPPQQASSLSDGKSEVSVRFESTPPGAAVSVDGRPMGNTPVDVKIAPALHRYRITLSGYFPQEGSADAREGTPVKVTLVAAH